MTLALTTGGGTITRVPTWGGVATTGAAATFTDGVGSSVGSTMFAVLTNITGTAVTAAPRGWQLLTSVDQGGVAHIEAWTYSNNPGGIKSISFTWATSTYWEGSVFEYTNVNGGRVLDGTAIAFGTATSGTTLPLITGGNLTVTGDLGIAAWVQKIAVASIVTFTSVAPFSRLNDSSGTSEVGHYDIEQVVNPTTGATLTAALTSSNTTVSAAGLLFVLEPVSAAAVQTNYLKAGSMTMKVNTLDFSLVDPAAVPALGDPCTVTDSASLAPTWSGYVVSVTKSDIVGLPSGHKLVTVTAVNSVVGGAVAAPFDLSDVATGGHILLEDGSGALLLEDGSGYLMLENSTVGFTGLSVQTSLNSDGTITTYGMCTVMQSGFAAGQTFHLTSGNLGYSSKAYVITNVTDIWLGLLTTPKFLIEFGDPILTLQQAGAGVLHRL